MTTTTLEATTRKTLIAQTSDQLFKKLQNGKLMGISKKIAIEILTKRKNDGKFEGDLSLVVTIEKKKETIDEKVEEEPVIIKENVVKVEKEKKEKSPSRLSLSFPDFKLKFKKGDEVIFIPFRETKEIKGIVVSSHLWKQKNKDVHENVVIRVGNKNYLKKAELITKL